MTNRQDTPNPGHRLAAVLGAALFLATMLTITPRADAICVVCPCTVSTTECVNQEVDTVWNLVCNPINPTSPDDGPSEPSGPDSPTAIRECKNVNDLVAYAVQEAGWAIGYANGWVVWAENLATHPCGSQSCLQACSGGTGYVVD
ncbi:MAG: hypothetical protein LC623_04890, partial [Halobacteriales archaeon]|nr:hypothetical protein [Halobacteriales archaeon]